MPTIAASHAASKPTTSINTSPLTSRFRIIYRLSAGSVSLEPGELTTSLKKTPPTVRTCGLALLRTLHDALPRVLHSFPPSIRTKSRTAGRPGRAVYSLVPMKRRPRVSDEPERHSDRLKLIEHYATGEALHMDADAFAAQRLLLPGDVPWPPELVRLREALARAREE